MPPMRRLLAPLLAVTALGVTMPGATMLGVPAAQAAPGKGPVFGLRAGGNPKLGYFVYELAPGGSRTGRVIVSNTGSATGTVKLFPADATTGSTSGTVYRTDRAPARGGLLADARRSGRHARPRRASRGRLHRPRPEHREAGPVGRRNRRRDDAAGLELELQDEGGGADPHP